ncbi:MAG: ankyrin repeat domain-containing protein [Terracidiphilus sp.]|nr:ankyrin repeat domain-containing protein [Terracidiphilus sp.]
MKNVVFAIGLALLATVALAETPAQVDTTEQLTTTEQLARATELGSLPVLFLLEEGAKVDERDAQGETPLLRAARLHRTDSARLLLLWGADVEARTADGRTPLMVAVCTKPGAEERSEEQLGTVAALLEWSASLEAKDKNGETALTCETNAIPERVRELLTNAAAQRAALAKAEEHAKLAKAGDNAPEVRFNLLLKEFGRNQEDNYVRGLLFEAAAKLTKPRAIPPEAERLHNSALLAINTFSEDPQLDRPIAELRRVVELAPWWRQGYYDLAKALQKNGQYEWACEQMEQYLRSQPPADELKKAREEYAAMEEQLDTHLQSLK